MASVAERYAAAAAYVRRAVATVEAKGISYAVDPITGVVEWYAGRVKTEPARSELERIEARWLRATNDIERARVARDAELLADRVQESLPGTPQDRKRTNLWKGEEPSATPATSYAGEVEAQAGETWSWIKDAAHSTADEAASLGKLILTGGSIVLGWKVFDYLRERQRNKVRSASTVENRLNTNLARVARRRDARARRRPAVRARLDETELHTWFERDRAHVELRDKRTGQTIIEWWDEDVAQAIEHGFLPHRWTQQAAHRAAYDYAVHVGLVVDPTRNATGRRRLYSLRLTRGELSALRFLHGRYTSAKALFDGLVPLDASADAALAEEFVRGDGPYRFQIRGGDVRKALRATVHDGGNYGAIPNLRSDAIAWLLAEEAGTS